MKAKHIFWLILIGVIAFSCKDESVDDVSSPGYNYFPLDTASFVIYEVDTIFHDQPLANVPGIHDSTHYFVKEVIDSEFQDAQDESSFRIVRYKRNDSTEAWVLSDVWYAKRTALNAQRVEENSRYVKLGFPISQFSNWDGNALNQQDEWRCEYDSLYRALDFGDLTFSKTVTVAQRDYLTAVNDEYAYEIYAEDVGLIFRHHKVLYTRPSYLNYRDAESIISGYEYKWKIIDYGIE